MIQGTNLSGVTSVTLGDGITVEQFSNTNASQIDVRFSVANNASTGARTITINTSRGSATSSSLLTVDNNRAPTAKMQVSPQSGAKNTAFLFDASESEDSDGTISTYHWDFGDGKSENGKVVTHKYATLGKFDAELTVTDNDQATDAAGRQVEVVAGAAPVARYFVKPESGDIRTVFTFDGRNSSDSDGTVASYSWKFDDGATASGVEVSHQFKKQGVYGVELTVTDNDGLGGVVLHDLRVEEFNEQKAKDEIEDVVREFFDLFARLDKLSAEQIVVGFSKSENCSGRKREIDIIEAQQEVLKKTSADITGPIDILVHDSHLTANAVVDAHFEWEEKSGKKGEGDARHDFSLVFEDGQWLICNFTVAHIE